MQAEDYLEIFRVAFKNVGDGVDKERVAIAVMQEMGKDKRMQLALMPREQGRQQQRATPRQIAFLRTLGVLVGYGITKQKAAELIDQAKMNSPRQR